MISVQSTGEISRPVAEVFAFVADQTIAPKWKDGPHEVRRLTTGRRASVPSTSSFAASPVAHSPRGAVHWLQSRAATCSRDPAGVAQGRGFVPDRSERRWHLPHKSYGVPGPRCSHAPLADARPIARP